MKKCLLCLMLALFLPILSLAEETQCYRFDLRFHLEPEATGWTSRNIREGVAEFLELLRVQGSLSLNGNSFDLPFEITLGDQEKTRTGFRLWGVPSHYGLTSELLGDSVLLINNLATLEFALKAYNFTEMPLPKVALFESPYVHTSAFEWVAEPFRSTFLAEEGSRVIPYDDLVRFAALVAEEGMEDRAFSCWLHSVCLESGYDSDIEDAMSNAVEWAEEVFDPEGILVEVTEEAEVWTSGGWTLFRKEAGQWQLTLPPSLNEGCLLTVSGESGGSSLRLEALAADEDEATLLALSLEMAQEDESRWSLTFRRYDGMNETETGCRLEADWDGTNLVFTLNNLQAAPILRVTGTLTEEAGDPGLHYTPGDLLGVPGIINVLSVNDVSLAELISSVKGSLLTGLLPILVETPARSYAAVFDFMEAYGLLNMLSAGLAR